MLAAAAAWVFTCNLQLKLPHTKAPLIGTQVTKAAKLFRQAGCVAGDIKAALSSHIKHDEIDIPEEAEEPKKVSVSTSVCITSVS